VAEAQFRNGLWISAALLSTVFVFSTLGDHGAQAKASWVAASPHPVLGWYPYRDPKGSTLRLSALTGKRIMLSFSLVRSGWVGVTKTVPARSLTGTRRITFRYAGRGAMNSIEFKILYANGAIFGGLWRHVSNTNGRWRTIVVPYAQLTCWEGTGCKQGDPVAPRRIRKIDFAVSNKLDPVPPPADTSGRGSVSFGNPTASR
jgi:Carbohydrate binding domain (family 11)